MSDLYGAFEAAASRGEELDPRRRELLVEVIGRAASTRRRRRNGLNAAASLVGVGLVGGAMTAAAGMWGPADGTAGPADATGWVSVSPPASPSATESDDPFAQPAWLRAEAGWFLVEYQTLEEDSRLLLVDPEGENRLVEPPAEYAGGRVAAWLGGQSLVPETIEGQGGLAAREDTIVGVVDARRTVHSTPVSGAELIQVATDRDVDTAPAACFTGDAYGEALLTPDKTGIVCFEPVTGDSTVIALAPTSGFESAQVLAEFSFPASDYARLGWLSDTELLFGRALDKGYRYFTFDIVTGELADVFLPGDLDGWVPTYDLGSETYRLAKPGKVEFLTKEGDPLATIECAADLGMPQAWVSATTALVACPGLGSSEWDLTTVDLKTGDSTTVISIADSDGEDALVGVFPHPASGD